MCVCVCVCSNANYCAIARFGFHVRCDYMALSVVYFLINHHLGKPHYVWDEYLYSVLEKVQVRMTVCVTVCVV